MKNTQTKFYKAGLLEEKGTKISLKVRPYIQGMIFNPEDPITSFHNYLIILRTIVDNYEIIKDIPGLRSAMPFLDKIKPEDIAYSKQLIDFLSLSPIEITLKSQPITQNIINDIRVTQISNDGSINVGVGNEEITVRPDREETVVNNEPGITIASTTTDGITTFTVGADWFNPNNFIAR